MLQVPIGTGKLTVLRWRLIREDLGSVMLLYYGVCFLGEKWWPRCLGTQSSHIIAGGVNVSRSWEHNFQYCGIDRVALILDADATLNLVMTFVMKKIALAVTTGDVEEVSLTWEMVRVALIDTLDATASLNAVT